MKISTIASTKVGNQLSIDEALDFGGKSAGICYMPDTFNTLLNEPLAKTRKRTEQTLISGHHSVYDHAVYNLLLEDMPKFIAMVLNNEKMYTTSEKSARYTKMELTPKEAVLYTKWVEIFTNVTYKEYPFISATQVHKLAQENARYLTSVFTPTTMEYTVSLRQINYIRSMMEQFIKNTPNSSFTIQIKSHMQDFIDQTAFLAVDGLVNTNRSLSLFDDSRHNRMEHFSDTYCTTYYASFAMLAQAQRHRTLDYKMLLQESMMSFYVPPIIRASKCGNDTLEKMWLYDISSVADIFPQGMIVQINERGTYENFMLKCQERLCGVAQLEIMQATEETFTDYIENSNKYSGIIIDYVSKGYDVQPRCTFPNYVCKSPCVWGSRDAFTRFI